jgi:TonB-linked SusC/RagA family outer membrane protein
MKKLIFLILLFFNVIFAFAQTNVRGKILDKLNQAPLAGVNVIQKNTSSGVVTDFDGNFTIEDVSPTAVFIISYVGFKTQVISFQDNPSPTILLEEDLSALDEIVVVGYGTQLKKEVTGAVSVLGSKDIQKLNPVRVEQALQGQVAGVNVTAASGAPGSGSNIRIRGISTNGDSRPLILVDGNIIEDLSVINPSDIKSINILKDATAGIYGVQAANGVILIETKTGKINTPIQISLDSYYGIQNTSRKVELIDNAYDYATFINNSSLNGGGRIKFYPIENTRLVFNLTDPNNPIKTFTDWQDEVFQTAAVHHTNISINGGTNKLSYSFGASLLNQDGIVGLEKSNYSRTTARANLQYDLIENLKLSGSLIYTNSTKNNLIESSIGSVLYSALNIDPFTTVRSTDQNSNGYGDTLVTAREVVNPIAMIENTYNTSRIDKISTTSGIAYSILNGLTVESKFQYNHAAVLTDIFLPVFNYGPGKQGTVLDNPNVIKDDGNSLTDNANFYEDYKFENFISYVKEFNESHKINALLGTSIQEFKGLFTGRSGRGLINDRNSIEDAIFAFVPPENIRDRFNENQKKAGDDRFISRLESIFTRIQYSYKDKYLLSAVLRRDGSSKFGKLNRYGYFPSGSLGWNISEENFLKNNSIISYFKLRASYGVIGSDRIELNRFISLLDGEALYTNNDETDADDVLMGKAIGGLSNPEIRWENTVSGNLGIDAKFFDNDLSISLDIFSKKTNDLLVQANVSGILGAAAPGSSPPIINAGDVLNEGFEALIAYNKIINENLSFNVSYNFSKLNNEVVYVGSSEGFLEGGSFLVGENLRTSRMEKGYPIGYFYGYKTNGVYQNQAEIDALNFNAPAPTNGGTKVYHSNAKPGDLKFVDLNGDNTITVDDKTYLGDPIPDITMGLSIGLNFKNFDFTSSAFASIGNDLVRDYERKNLYANKGSYVLNSWTSSNPSNSVPRPVNGASVSYDNFSDYFVEDASYVRIQNIQVGYTLRESLAQKIALKNCRIYLSGNNLFTFTNYKGYDPSAVGGGTDGKGEPIGSGIDKGFYPVAKTFLIGMSLNF